MSPIAVCWPVKTTIALAFPFTTVVPYKSLKSLLQTTKLRYPQRKAYLSCPASQPCGQPQHPRIYEH